MARTSLTDTVIRALKAPNKRLEIGDCGQGSVGGLFLILQPSGAMSWALRYRSPVDGRTRKLTLGQCLKSNPNIKTAREKARSAKEMIADGLDPGDQKQAQKEKAKNYENTVSVQLDRYLDRHVRANNKQSTIKEVERLVETFVRPNWGRRKIDTIARRDVVALLDKIIDRGTGTTANRVFALVRKFSNWGVERGVIEVSFTEGLKAPAKERSRARVLTDQEIQWLWKSTGSNHVFDSLIRTALLTGARRSEVAGMNRRELDINNESPEWHIPAERTKNTKAHVVPLSKLAVTTIDNIPMMNKSKLIFTTTGETPFSGFTKSKRRLDETMIKLARKEAEERGDDPAEVNINPWTIHDLRRTCASGLAALGIRVEVTEAVLNHKSGSFAGIVSVYQRHDYADEKRRALNAWSEHIEYLISGRASEKVFKIMR